MSESFLIDLSKEYYFFLDAKEQINELAISIKEVIERMKSDNGFDTHGLPEEHADLELYYKKVTAFLE
jgi:hypothetical protein